jgi:hypothetical protein
VHKSEEGLAESHPAITSLLEPSPSGKYHQMIALSLPNLALESHNSSFEWFQLLEMSKKEFFEYSQPLLTLQRVFRFRLRTGFSSTAAQHFFKWAGFEQMRLSCLQPSQIKIVLVSLQHLFKAGLEQTRLSCLQPYQMKTIVLVSLQHLFKAGLEQ